MFEIKEVFVEDVEELSNIAIKAYSDHYLHFWYDDGDWYLDKSFSVPNLRKEFLEETSRFYLAIFGGKPIGFLKTRTDRTLSVFENKNVFEVERIYLRKTATGKGIGKALMNFADEQAKAENIDFVWLKVMDSSSSAIAFYKSQGFEKCGTETLPYSQMKKELRGMFIMKKNLNS